MYQENIYIKKLVYVSQNSKYMYQETTIFIVKIEIFTYNKQINGVAMGTKMGPSYANLFVGYVENQFFNQ